MLYTVPQSLFSVSFSVSEWDKSRDWKKTESFILSLLPHLFFLPLSSCLQSCTLLIFSQLLTCSYFCSLWVSSLLPSLHLFSHLWLSNIAAQNECKSFGNYMSLSLHLSSFLFYRKVEWIFITHPHVVPNLFFFHKTQKNI